MLAQTYNCSCHMWVSIESRADVSGSVALSVKRNCGVFDTVEINDKVTVLRPLARCLGLSIAKVLSSTSAVSETLSRSLTCQTPHFE